LWSDIHYTQVSQPPDDSLTGSSHCHRIKVYPNSSQNYPEVVCEKLTVDFNIKYVQWAKKRVLKKGFLYKYYNIICNKYAYISRKKEKRKIIIHIQYRFSDY
jgi:hypothetical protein